ncbi:MAG: DUF3078 domain-containing protein [Candidatus Krumholzibacteria bacterium]|nr:DUF3078 domain-containing protein [Candidatus Krumholzibacteria bacterium]MDH4337728.1 DUF3078 domain-containing protein [Candidatus Krumholzibacteria bacterium]MDH5270644.1 DUF3078 domain-containing protein [Candidatus Krumholzibacteria bacterium]
MLKIVTPGLLAVLIAGTVSTAFAQEAIAPEVPKEAKEKRVLEVGKWYPTLEGGLNLTQASYSENWKGGETGSVSWNAFLNGSAENQVKPTLNWLSSMKLLYGQTRRQEIGANGDRSWGDAEKSADLIQIESILRLTRNWAVDPYLSVRYESFFQDITDPFGRKLWINPMTFKESTGIARKFKDREDDQLLMRAGFTARENYRQFYASDTGNETFSETSWDVGAELIVDYKKVFEQRLTYVSRLSVYQPFNWSKNEIFDALGPDSLIAAGLSPDIASYATTVDVDWQNTFTTKVTKFISFNFYLEILYDKYDNTVVPIVDDNGALTNAGAIDFSVRKKGQFKQTFGVGLSYTFK